MQQRKKTEILIGPTPDAALTYGDPYRFKWVKLLDRDEMFLIPAPGSIHFKAGTGSVSFCLSDNTYWKKYPGGAWANDPSIVDRAIGFTTNTQYNPDFDRYNSSPTMIPLLASGGYTAHSTGVSEVASMISDWLGIRLDGLRSVGQNTVVCIFPGGLVDVDSLKYRGPTDIVIIPDPSIFPAVTYIYWDVSGLGASGVVPIPATVTHLGLAAWRWDAGDNSLNDVPLPAGLVELNLGGSEDGSAGISAKDFTYTAGGPIAGCPLLTSVWMRTTFSSPLPEATVEAVLADLVTAGAAGGNMDMRYQPRSLAADASIVLLQGAGWTVVTE